MLSYRSGGVTSILLLLFPDICFAFSGVCKSKHHTKRSRRRITAMLFVKKKGSDIIDISSNDHEQDNNISDRIRWHRRQKMKHNIESQTTTAGVEQLFSISLWSSFITRRIQNKRKVSSSSDTIILSSNQEDLPSIDNNCKQLCNSNQEEIQLQQMKLLLESDMQIIIEKGLHITYPDVYGDLRLLRFLRKSEDRDIISAADRYKSFIQWREENNVDEIRSTISSSCTPPLDTKLQRVASYFPMNFNDMIGESNTTSYDDTAFQPSAILYIGSFDTKGISSEIRSSQSDIALEDFLDYWIYIYESIHHRLYQHSIQCGEMIRLDEVCDLEGLTIQQFSPYFVTKIMKPWLTLTQSMYPETTRKIIVLNSPSIVNVAWNLVTPLLSQGTVDKICFEDRSSSKK